MAFDDHPTHTPVRERIGVVLLISNLEYGGAQRQVVELANGMDRGRFDVQICSLSDYVPLADKLRDADRQLHIVNKRSKFDVSVVSRVAKLLRHLESHIVHGFLFDAEIAARLAGRLAGVSAVIGSERNTDYSLKARQRLAYRLTKPCVDVIVANSHAGAAFNSRTLGHAPSQYRVVHNGVDVDFFAPKDGAPIRHELGISQRERVAGMFASFKERKNHGMLFTAAGRVLERVPNLRLLLVGDELYGGMHGSDTYKERMQRMVDDLGLRDRCVFLGNRSDVASLYGACDVTVLPSRHEGTPNVLLESMACGVPVIATDVADNAYVVPDERVGYVVPLDDTEALADRMVLLLSDETHCREMGDEARAWVVEEFSNARLAAKFAEIYENCLNGRAHAHNLACADAGHGS